MEDTYKLIHNEKEKSLELYNIIEDPGELKNLTKSHSAITDEMKKELFDWKDDVMNDLAKIEQRQ